jgi:NAD+ kinase
VGKYQAEGIRGVLEEIAHFLVARARRVARAQTAHNTGISRSSAVRRRARPRMRHRGRRRRRRHDARHRPPARRHGTPLVGINQGRLGFITDVAVGEFDEALAPMSTATTKKSAARCSKARSGATAR